MKQKELQALYSGRARNAGINCHLHCYGYHSGRRIRRRQCLPWTSCRYDNLRVHSRSRSRHGVIRVIMRKNSILESNIVQTIGSAGESLAAGAIFTLPALFLWAADGKMETPSILEITLIALLGGLLGVLFMVPLRNALIVKEHGILPYPEGTACAEVLLAGEEGGANASTVFARYGICSNLQIRYRRF